jgi:nascent polypeptide-associated complex subunit alpha
MGTPEEQTAESRNPEISDDDIEAVVNKTGCSEDEARQAIEENDYDLAAAIMAVKDE